MGYPGHYWGGGRRYFAFRLASHKTSISAPTSQGVCLSPLCARTLHHSKDVDIPRLERLNES